MKTNRTYRQMYNRCQLGNLAANNHLYACRLARPFENKPPRQTDYNLFVQANYGINPVFLKQSHVVSGACVLAPYMFTRGSLPSVNCQLNAGGVLRSDLSLGQLVITTATTVADFSQALVANNPDWREGDELYFFHALQIIDTYTEIPRARMTSCHLVLDTTDTELLYNLVSAVGFASVNENENQNQNGASAGSEPGYWLGMNCQLVNAGAAWVHSRKRADSTLRVSTQHLHVVSDILADYQSEEAFQQAAESYGAINNKDVYIAPQSTLSTLTDFIAVPVEG